MDYEKKYKKALEKAKDMLSNKEVKQDAMIELSKVTPQPKQEWSKEDKAIVLQIEQMLLY